MRFKKVAIIGVGLLGGSLGQALRQRRLAGEVVGYVRRTAAVTECERRGAVNRATTDLSEATRGADLVVLCTPVGRMRELADALMPALKPGALVTDVGSVKGTVVREVGPRVRRAGGEFIGSHPMAGAEKMGVAYARAGLFVDAVCVVTPTARTSAKGLGRVEKLWRQVGARVLRMAPAAHDRLVARSSHLPQALAATLAAYVLDRRRDERQRKLCAGGFRDSTRVASGSPEMWRDIMLANRDSLARALREFGDRLKTLRQAVERGDATAIGALLESAKCQRDEWLNQFTNGSSE